MAPRRHPAVRHLVFKVARENGTFRERVAKCLTKCLAKTLAGAYGVSRIWATSRNA